MDIIVGIALGALLFFAKMGSFYLLTGGENQTNWLWTGVGMRDWWYGGPKRKFTIDIISGYVGSHIIPTNSTFGAVALITYTITCMFILFKGIIYNKTKAKANSILEVIGL